MWGLLFAELPHPGCDGVTVPEEPVLKISYSEVHWVRKV
jgi:hypothetical protein